MQIGLTLTLKVPGEAKEMYPRTSIDRINVGETIQCSFDEGDATIYRHSVKSFYLLFEYTTEEDERMVMISSTDVQCSLTVAQFVVAVTRIRVTGGE